MRIFAPSDTHELKRIIKPSGYLLTATPGPRHLWQLKEQIYSDAKEHTHESEVPEDFELFSSQRVSYKIAPTIEQRMALLEMTPLTWSANEKTKETLSGYSELEIEIDFISATGELEINFSPSLAVSIAPGKTILVIQRTVPCIFESSYALIEITSKPN